jgi:hypothetical protein
MYILSSENTPKYTSLKAPRSILSPKTDSASSVAGKQIFALRKRRCKKHPLQGLPTCGGI